MSERTFVVIFLFWAVLTIVTPTLVLLSESSKSYLHSDVDKNGGIVNARKMMGYAEKQPGTKNILSAPMEAPTPTPEPAETVVETRWSNLRKILNK